MLNHAKIILIILLPFLSAEVFPQTQTVGLLSYRPDKISDGYTLFFPRNQSTVYLINNCGEIIHTWEDDSIYVPNNAVYLLPNGNLVKCKKNPQLGLIGTGGGDYYVEMRSWDNELLWAHELNSATERLHHDVEVLPNGNILMIAWEKKTSDVAIANGRLPESMTHNYLYPDYIFEMNPESDERVWEWHVWDHLIQDVDSTKLNFGNVSVHSELIDINYAENQGVLDWDWLHINAVDYNENLDQIMLCVPYFNEIWVIDHSTSTEEAAGHTGGQSGMGGDILYRIGNPQAYKNGTEQEKILFFPHDSHWTNEFIKPDHPDYGKILIFNNNVGNGFSKMEKFESPWNSDSLAYEKNGSIYEPSEFVNSITHPNPSSFYSTALSGVQQLPNGNILGCSGKYGHIVELSADNEVVWEYKVPIKAGHRIEQGTILQLNDNLTFRAFKYPEDFVAFEGKDLSPKGFIELEAWEDYCERLVSTQDPTESDFTMYPNPTSDILNIERSESSQMQFQVYDINGQKVVDLQHSQSLIQLDVSEYSKGVYFLVVDKTQRFVFSVF